jgi:hypothetical protein
MAKLKAPFPWFGGKSVAADRIWVALGPDVTNYVEPFAGSAAVLLARPGGRGKIETINDADGFVSNFWRAMASDPEAVARHADWPVNEVDLHARHARLVGMRGELTADLMGDPNYFDARIAGWWVWGVCAWIGSGWCSGSGPWVQAAGRLFDTRQLPHLGDAGQGINDDTPVIWAHLQPIAERMRNVRVACGDWERVCSPSVTTRHGVTGVLLDPPYSSTAANCFAGAYAVDDDAVSSKARAWAIEHGDDPKLRIVLCGYEGEHEMPPSWSVVEWKAHGGYGGGGGGRGDANSHRERLWLSPHCLRESEVAA